MGQTSTRREKEKRANDEFKITPIKLYLSKDLIMHVTNYVYNKLK